MSEDRSLKDQIQAVKNDQLERSDLVASVYDIARNYGERLRTSEERTDFIATTNALGITTDDTIVPALRQAYIDTAITPPHWGNNVAIGLSDFEQGMRELGTNDDEIANYIAQTLEYRVVEGLEFGACVECVSMPFVKENPAKTKVKDTLQRLQKEPTAVQSNQDSMYKSSWNTGKAQQIEALFRDHEETLYAIAHINEQMDSFDNGEVYRWRSKASDESDRMNPKIIPERLSDEGQEGEYKTLLIEQQRLESQLPERVDSNHRAVDLAQLDILLESDYVGGAGGKSAMHTEYFSIRAAEIAAVLNAS